MPGKSSRKNLGNVISFTFYSYTCKDGICFKFVRNWFKKKKALMTPPEIDNESQPNFKQANLILIIYTYTF